MRAVFLDRDGTINIDYGYVHRVEDFRFTHHAPEAIKELNDAGFLVIVITNQSGVGRGFFTLSDVNALHMHIDTKLTRYGAHIDAYYICPHVPEDSCACRKPKPGLVLQAAARFEIDLSKSWFVGDKATDIQCAQNAGVMPMLIRSGNSTANCTVFDDLYECVQNIVSRVNVAKKWTGNCGG